MEKSERVIRTGWLIKSPPLKSAKSLFEKWQLRYFALVEICLNFDPDGIEFLFMLKYYEKDSDFRKSSQPLDQINLDDCLSIELNNGPIGNLRYVINLHCKDRLYHLCAKTETQSLGWLRTLREYRFGKSQIMGLPPVVKSRKGKGRLRRACSLLSSPRSKSLMENWPDDDYEYNKRASLCSHSDEISVSSASTTGSDASNKSLELVTTLPLTKTCSVQTDFPAERENQRTSLVSLPPRQELLEESSDEDDYEDMTIVLQQINGARPRSAVKSFEDLLRETSTVTHL